MHLMTRMANTLEAAPLVAGQGDNVVLTATGREVLPLPRRLVQAFEAFNRPPTEIRFTAYPSHAAASAKTVAGFVKEHPGVSVIFHEISDESRRDRGTRLIQQVVDGIADLAIAPSGRSRPHLTEERLYEWTLRVILPTSDHHRNDPTIRLDDLSNHEFLVSPHGHMSRELFDAIATESKWHPVVAMELMDQNVLAQIARSSKRYAAVMPDDAFGNPDPRLGPALLGARKRIPTRASYSLYYLAPRKTDATSALRRIDLARQLAHGLIDHRK